MPEESLETLHEDGFEPAFDETDIVIDHIDGQEAIKLIAKIREPYGESVFMKYVQGLTLEEIAELTGESRNTISVRLHRGLEILKKLFNHEHEPQ
jgi:RNA polymerase sigma factor (sigma-70 family)